MDNYDRHKQPDFKTGIKALSLVLVFMILFVLSGMCLWWIALRMFAE